VDCATPESFGYIAGGSVEPKTAPLTTEVPLTAHGKEFVYIGYIDDSGSTGGNTEDIQSHFQVIGGPIINSLCYTSIRLNLSAALERVMEPDQWDTFEFHANKMFHAKEGAYKLLGQDKCWELLKQALEQIAENKMPVLYAVVDKRKFDKELSGAVEPMRVCCNKYFMTLSRWASNDLRKPLKDKADSDIEPMLLIGDARHDDKSSQLRKHLSEAFRREVKRVSYSKSGWGDLSTQLFDDIYFGDSKTSIGVQLADICVFFKHRQLHGHPDAKGFYDIISNLVFEPNE
jgi:uncharacterized protein DUF3800